MILDKNDTTDKGICGLITKEQPYSLKWKNNNEFEILFHNKTGYGQGQGNPKYAQEIIDGLNRAYQLGFHHCSIEFMNKKG